MSVGLMSSMIDKKVIKNQTIKFNKRFANGEQYLTLTPSFDIIEEGKKFYWQQRDVFNIILPIIVTPVPTDN